MVDANGAFDAGRGERAGPGGYAAAGVRYFEEPVSSDDLAGLRRVRDRAPAGLAVAAGEYAWSPLDVGRDARRRRRRRRCRPTSRAAAASPTCVRIDALCAAHIDAAVAALRARRERALRVRARARCGTSSTSTTTCGSSSMLFDGALSPTGGELVPDLSVPGHGLTLRRADAERFQV